MRYQRGATRHPDNPPSDANVVPNPIKLDYSAVYLVLCIGSNLGLKFGPERPIRVLLPHLAEPKIYK